MRCIADYHESMDKSKEQKISLFLRKLRELGDIKAAAEAAKVPQRTIYYWRYKDSEFSREIRVAVAHALLGEE